MPSPLPRQVPWSLFARVSPWSAAFPVKKSGRLLCHCFFEACSAFTHVTACTLAESPCDPLHRKLRQLRCLCCRFDCYRVERTSSRAGVAPAEVQRLSTAHCFANYPWQPAESNTIAESQSACSPLSCVDLPFVRAYDSPWTVRGRSIFSMANQSVNQDSLVGQPLGHYRIVGITEFLSTSQTHGG